MSDPSLPKLPPAQRLKFCAALVSIAALDRLMARIEERRESSTAYVHFDLGKRLEAVRAERDALWAKVDAMRVETVP